MSKQRERDGGPVVPQVPVLGSDPDERVGSSPPGMVDVGRMDTTIGAASGGYLRDESPDPDDLEQARLRLRDAQVALVSLGYDVTDGSTGGGGDGINGIWGGATRDAISEFQGEHDLRCTGQLDLETYEAILGAYEISLESEGGDRDMSDDDDSNPWQPDRPLKLDR